MKLSDVERLARRIGDLLDGKVPEEQARPIAQEYANAADAAARRLRQCIGMLEEGDETQALQLADAAPPLLDLVTRLGFRRLDEWQQHCKQQGLPRTENLDAKFIRQLSDAYGKGITPHHDLYRQLREAMHRRDDLRIVEVLRGILRRNPTDTDIREQILRFEQKILAQFMHRLAEAISNQDSARVLALIGEVESLEFASKPSGETWKNALRLRCQLLLQQALRSRHRSAINVHTSLIQSVEPLLAEIHSILEDEGISLAPEDATTLADCDVWLGKLRRQAAEDRDFLRALDELRRLVDAGEVQLQETIRWNRPILRERIRALESAWRHLSEFHREIDSSLDPRRRKVLEVLQGQLDMRDRAVRRLAVAASAVLTLLALVAGRAFWNRNAALDLTTRLRALRESRQTLATEQLLIEARIHATRIAGATPTLVAETEEAARFIAVEQDQVRSAEDALQQLTNHVGKGFDRAAVETIARQFADVTRALGEVAPDRRPPLEATLAPWRGRWIEWLGSHRTVRQRDFDTRLQALEQESNQLRYDRGPDGVAGILGRLDGPMRELSDLANPPVPELRPSAESLARHASLSNRLAAFAAQVDRWRGIVGPFENPTTLEAYLAALRNLQQSEFASPKDQAGAGALLALGLDTQSLPAGLLFPGATEAWRRFRLRPELAGMPSTILPEERTRFDALRKDPNLFNTYRYQIVRRGQPTEPPILYSRGILTTNQKKRLQGIVYDPATSPGSLDFSEKSYGALEATLTPLGPAEESLLADSIGLRRFVPLGTGTNFAVRILEMLDALNRSDIGNPLGRAYLAVSLHDLMSIRPHEWDAQWAPQAAADLERLRAIGASSIASGDWFRPEAFSQLHQRLGDHFARARQVSYLHQARFLNALARAALSTGFDLVGHVDGTGTPKLPTALPPRTELWGWAETNRSPTLLFRTKPESTPVRLPPAMTALPWTPLFRFKGDRRAILQSTRSQLVEGGPETAVGTNLPPFFAFPYE